MSKENTLLFDSETTLPLGVDEDLTVLPELFFASAKFIY